VYVTLPNLMFISKTAAEMMIFSIFEDGEFSKTGNLKSRYGSEMDNTSQCQI